MGGEIDWGIYLITAQPPGMTEAECIDASVAYAVEAEKLGYGHAWVLEHHFTRYGIVGSALTHAAFILGRTQTLRVGTAISVIPLEHPVRLAEQVALLDHLSGGRLMFGIGRGIFLKDFTVFGVDMGSNREILSEWMDIIMRAWTQKTVLAEGDLISFPEVEVLPKPRTQPHPLVYAAVHSPETIEWSARRGLPMLFNYTINDEAKRSQLDLYNAVAEDAGHNIDAIPHALSFIAGASYDGTLIKDRSRAHLTWWLDEFTRASDLLKRHADGIRGYEWQKRQWEAMVMRNEHRTGDRVERLFKQNPIGSPQECVDKLGQSLEITGLKKVILGFDAAGAREHVLDSIHVFTEEVLPRLN